MTQALNQIPPSGLVQSANYQFQGLTVSGVSNLGSVNNVRVTGGTDGQVLSAVGNTGQMSWTNPVTGGLGGNTYFASTTTLADIASTADINYVLPVGVSLHNGDYFFDTRTATNNTQPVYLYINGGWRQVLTAVGY
jgi:hypothetical protein